jgi:hypothetical protein
MSIDYSYTNAGLLEPHKTLLRVHCYIINFCSTRTACHFDILGVSTFRPTHQKAGKLVHVVIICLNRYDDNRHYVQIRQLPATPVQKM